MEKILSRLKKINGQVTALSRMIEEKKDCETVIMQFQAAQSALNGAFSLLLATKMRDCVAKKTPGKMEKLLKLITKQK